MFYDFSDPKDLFSSLTTIWSYFSPNWDLWNSVRPLGANFIEDLLLKFLTCQIWWKRKKQWLVQKCVSVTSTSYLAWIWPYTMPFTQNFFLKLANFTDPVGPILWFLPNFPKSRLWQKFLHIGRSAGHMAEKFSAIQEDIWKYLRAKFGVPVTNRKFSAFHGNNWKKNPTYFFKKNKAFCKK